jgi:hypothetical protein
MSNQYELALRLWGAQKLKEYYRTQVVPDTVDVRLDFDPGYACCGGRDPDCYCSYWEAPSVNIEITGFSKTGGNMLNYRSNAEDFNFFMLMRELSAIEIEEES